MSMEKSLYAAPEGLDALTDEPILDIEVLGPEDEVEIEITGEDGGDFDENLAEKLSDSVMASIASELIADFDEDISARRDWMQTYVDGLELLGMKIEDRTEPWPGACGVYHPLLSEALVKFQAETMSSTFPAAGPVKTQIIGAETPQKKDASDRVRDDMNYQITDVMVEYRPEHERMAWGLGLSGNAFKKVYYDPDLRRQVSIFVPAEDIVVPYGASNIQTSPRVTHIMRKTENELRKMQVNGFYIDEDLGEPNNVLDDIEKKIAEKMGFQATSDNRYKLLEMHVDIDLDGYEHIGTDGEPTGIALPYVVTLEYGSNKILAIRRNWRPEDDNYQKRQHFVHYGYVPGFGFYCFGLIHLVGAFAKSGTSLIRQLVDAGTLSNLPGGFKTRGLRIKGDNDPIAPGEWKDVDVPSGTMKDNIMPLPYKEPSQVLASLLEKIIEEGRRLAGAGDFDIAEMSANAPVGTTLALIERTLKVMSAVQARIHYSMKQELKLLRDIIRDYTPEDYNYDPVEGNRRAKRGDYDMVEVIPVSDPNAATMSQKVVQYQAVLQLAQQAPQLYDLAQLHRQMLGVLGIQNAQKLVPLDEDQLPRDPISENISSVKGKPMKAFISQDHDAHIAAHSNFMQDPVVMQTIGQNPNANMIMASLQAHIAEHLGYQYRAQIEAQLGFTLPPPDEQLPEEAEVQLSRLIAQASTQLKQIHMGQAAQAKAQQMAEDPILKIQQDDNKIKAAEVQRKAKKDEVDAQIAAKKLALDEQKISNTQRDNQARIRADLIKTSAGHEHASNLKSKELTANVLAQRNQAKEQK